MYLAGLNFDEKIAFYSLAASIVSTDGVIAKEEELLLDQFLGEMNVSKEVMSIENFESAIELLLPSNITTKKKIYIELVALAMCDNDFAQEESDLLNQIADKFNFSPETENHLRSLVFELLDIYKRMSMAVME